MKCIYQEGMRILDSFSPLRFRFTFRFRFRTELGSGSTVHHVLNKATAEKIQLALKDDTNNKANMGGDPTDGGENEDEEEEATKLFDVLTESPKGIVARF